MCLYYPGVTEPNDVEMQFFHISYFWRACIILTILSCYNHQSIGGFVWREVPSVRMLMEMLITQNFLFPPIVVPNGPSLATEKKFQEEERTYILTLLKGRSDSETNLLSQLIRSDIGQMARQPPEQVINRIRELDKQFGLGRLLCTGRDPDFLLDIMKRQSVEKAIQWLGPIVMDNENKLLEGLPIECLCELLLSSQTEDKSNAGTPYIPAILAPQIREVLVQYLEADPVYTANITETESSVIHIYMQYILENFDPEVGYHKLAEVIGETISKREAYC